MRTARGHTFAWGRLRVFRTNTFQVDLFPPPPAWAQLFTTRLNGRTHVLNEKRLMCLVQPQRARVRMCMCVYGRGDSREYVPE